VVFEQGDGIPLLYTQTGGKLTNGSVVFAGGGKIDDAQGGSPATPVPHLIFFGITFAYGTWLLPSTVPGTRTIRREFLWSGPTNSTRPWEVSFQTAANIQLTKRRV